MIWYYALTFVLLIVFFVLVYFFYTTLLYILPMNKGAVYVPSKAEAIATMVALVRTKRKKARVVDLGSGDGRIVSSFADQGYEAYGFEINPLLVRKSRRLLSQAGIDPEVIIDQSYWDYDLSDFDVVIVYGITYIMEDLATKLRSELKPKALVVSNYFELPGWKKLASRDGIHLYQC